MIENRKDIDFEIKNALGKQGIVGLVMTPKATFAGAFQDVGLAWQLDELEVSIVESVTVNRGKKDGFVTGQDASMRLFDVLCPLSGEGEGQFSPMSYEEGEDGSLLVNKCILKCLVHPESGEPPAPWFPDRQGIKMSDGTVIPMGDGFFSPTGYDINTTLRTLGYTADDIAEIYVFSKLESTAVYSEHLKAVYIDSSCPSIGRDYWSQPFSGSNLEKVVFKGRTLEEVQAMQYYPWGLTNESIIITEP